MTITREDVQALSSAPGPGGLPVGGDQADRVAAVLNRHATSDGPSTESWPASRLPLSGTHVSAP